MVHQYKLNGYDIVLDTASGSVHLVDDVAYDIIEMYKSRTRTRSAPRYAQSTPWSRARMCSNASTTSPRSRQRTSSSPPTTTKSSQASTRSASKVIKALCLHVAHTCNLNCSYCFASQGKYHGERALMSFEVGRRALDFLVENSGTRRNLEVDFFGGEPLMNWQVVKDPRRLRALH